MISANIKDTRALLLEALVSGSKKPAEDGQLIFLTAGDRALLNLVAPYLDIIVKNLPWRGQECISTETCHQHDLGKHNDIIPEGLFLIEKVGVDPRILVEGVLSAPMLAIKGPQMIQSLYPTSGPLKYQQKDLRLVLELAESVSQLTRVVVAANEPYKAAKSKGFTGKDFSSVIEALKPKS